MLESFECFLEVKERPEKFRFSVDMIVLPIAISNRFKARLQDAEASATWK